MTLNDEQSFAIKCLKLKKNIFITSKGAGCGKTYLLNYIKDSFGSFWGFNKNVITTATTGVAALLLNQGRTIHNWAGIGIGDKPVSELINNIKKCKADLRWMKVDILIIDEISLMSPSLFDKLEEIARLIRNNNKPFGGIQLILSGDWLQLPNIDSEYYAFESKSWNKCIDITVYLKKILRQKNIHFQYILNLIRIGNINSEVKETLLSRVNKNLDNPYGIKPTKLFCINSDIERINNNELNKLKKKGQYIKDYLIQINLKYKSNLSFDQICKLSNLPKNLNLTEGCQVMLLTNLNLDSELVNGSRGIIKTFSENGLPIVTFLNNMTIEIEYKNIDIVIDDKIIGTIKQIPLKLAYASTIHKMQGSTLDYVIIDLEKMFEVSQGYVGLSRVKDLDCLSISKINFEKFKVNKKALQFYEELDSNSNNELLTT